MLLVKRATAATVIPGAEDRPFPTISDIGENLEAAKQRLNQAADAIERKIEVALPTIVLVFWLAVNLGLTFTTKTHKKGGGGKGGGAKAGGESGATRTLEVDSVVLCAGQEPLGGTSD